MVAALPLTIAVHAKQLDAVEEVCGVGLGCAGSDVLVQLLFLVVTGLLAVFVLAAIQRISEARRAVDEEQSRTATEREAFTRFAREVARLDPSQPAYQLAEAEGAVSATAVTGDPMPDRGLEATREAYRGTVMAMPHYEEEYAEPLARHMGEEFGEEVATVVTGSGQLTPELKSVLVDRAREAARERERLMRQLDGESEALAAAGDELSAVAEAVRKAETSSFDGAGFDALAATWRDLGEHESRLSRLLTRRQETVRPGRGSVGHSGRRPLNEFLYGALDSTFPVLADGVELADRVKGTRARVLAVLTTRA